MNKKQLIVCFGDNILKRVAWFDFEHISHRVGGKRFFAGGKAWDQDRTRTEYYI